ncbi:MAG: AAA family ATPase [Nanoarchaeota archaeon]|nr:AAA family ATPase [Nanoarchaeota archaeon]
MINKLILEYFKCFEKLQLPLSNLTLLSGVNSSGKSSILQALVLLNQTILDNEWSQSINLNGSILSLGTVGDVIDTSSSRYSTSIGIETNEYRYVWKLSNKDRLAYYIPFEKIHFINFKQNIEKEWSVKGTDKTIHKLIPRIFKIEQSQIDQFNRLTYISSDRIAPQETYKAYTLDKYSTVGSKGEYTPWFLLEYGGKEVNEILRIPNETFTLQRQAEAYLNDFFPDSGFSVKRISNMNFHWKGSTRKFLNLKMLWILFIVLKTK